MTDENEPIRKLVSAIVLQAVQDYIQALKDDNEKTIDECERFFRSEWGKFLSNIDGELIIKRLKNGYREFCELSRQYFESKQTAENAFKCPICNGFVYVKECCISPRTNKYGLRAVCRSCKFSLNDYYTYGKSKTIKNKGEEKTNNETEKNDT